MKTSAFLSKVSLLKNTVAATIQPVYTGLKMVGVIGSCASSVSLVNIVSLSKQIDELANECQVLIESHEKVKNLIEGCGAQSAGEKAATAAKLNKNNDQILSAKSEIKKLIIKISEYESKDAKRTEDRASLDKLHREIEERKKSGNQYIPFYGIKYVVDTNNKIDNYNRTVNAWHVLNAWLNSNRAQYHDQKARYYDLNNQVQQLKGENDKLQQEGGRICELLTILSCLIKAFQDFRVGIKDEKSKLESHLVKNVDQTTEFINSSFDLISSYNDILQDKIVGYASELPANILKSVQGLLSESAA